MSDPLRALIVDDEELARGLLRELLAERGDVEVVGEAANGFEAVKACAELRPDVVFLDIQMPKLSGFEVLELLEPRPAVVFVTAYDEHALRAFEVNAVDYLLKPFPSERLAAAIARAAERVRRREELPAGPLAAAARSGQPIERVLLREESGVVILPVEQIDWVEARDDSVCFHAAGRKHRKTQTLGEVEAQLDRQRFVRIHRSVLLNVARLQRLEPYAKDSWVAILGSGARLPVSRAGRKRLEELLGAL